MDIKQELLITLIQERPVIWDKTLENYKNKRLKFDAWTEIFTHLESGFHDLSGEEKNKFGQSVMKKWTNMKDNWIKYDKKMNECKSGSGAKRIRKYVFYDEMLFLKKIVEHRNTDSNMNLHENDELKMRNSRSEIQQSKKKKNELNEVDIKFMKFMGSAEREESSRSMNFFKGIADIVDKFSDANMIDFLFQVISIIKTIQHRENIQYIPTPTNQCNHDVQGYHSGIAPANTQLPMYGHPTSITSGSGVIRPHPQTLTHSYDFGQPSGSGLHPIPSRPESQVSLDSVNTENTTDSQESVEEFDFSSSFQ